jgi:hypothetical protein
MSLLAAVAVGSKVFGGLRKRKASKEMSAMARQQELMAQENAMLERRELAENVRRTELKNELTSGTALASAAASGVTLSGSTTGYLDFLETEQVKQLDWLQEAGASRIQQNLDANLLQARGTKLDAKNMRTSALTDFVGAFGMAGASGLFGKAGTGYNAGSYYSDVNIPLTGKEKSNLFK